MQETFHIAKFKSVELHYTAEDLLTVSEHRKVISAINTINSRKLGAMSVALTEKLCVEQLFFDVANAIYEFASIDKNVTGFITFEYDYVETEGLCYGPYYNRSVKLSTLDDLE